MISVKVRNYEGVVFNSLDLLVEFVYEAIDLVSDGGPLLQHLIDCLIFILWRGFQVEKLLRGLLQPCKNRVGRILVRVCFCLATLAQFLEVCTCVIIRSVRTQRHVRVPSLG